MSSARGSPEPEKPQPLVSWKEIAAFLGRAERTVKRWERERGLPVHRVPGGERGGVFAYPVELRAWLLGELGLAAAEQPPTHDRRQIPDRRRSVAPAEPAADESAPANPLSPDTSPDISHPDISAVKRPLLEWATVAAVVFALAIGGVLIVDRTPVSISAAGHGTAAESYTSSDNHQSKLESLYLLGRYQWNLRTADSLARSIDAYNQAVALDPQYAPAYAGLAESFELLPEYSHVDQRDYYARARVAAARAIAIDPNLAAGHRAMAFFLFWGDWDVPGSDAEFRRALALAPDDAQTHHWYSTTLLVRQEDAKAIAHAATALRLEPTNPAIATDTAWVYARLRKDRPAALETLRNLARTQPALVKPVRYLAWSEFEDGNYDAFTADLQTAASISHNPDELALADAASRGWANGGKAGLLETMLLTQKAAFDNGHTSGLDLARTYLLLGKPDDALPYFNAAFDRRDFGLMALPACDCMANLRNNPGYAKLIYRIRRRMRLPSGTLTAVASASLPDRPSPSSR
jgi:tetratricopeptide (TPR) repeat protein